MMLVESDTKRMLQFAIRGDRWQDDVVGLSHTG